MRHYILTEKDRERLKKWLNKGNENQNVLNIFSDLRRDFPRLRDDILLIIKVIRRLQQKRRWDLRMKHIPPSAYASLRDGSISTLRKDETSTSCD